MFPCVAYPRELYCEPDEVYIQLNHVARLHYVYCSSPCSTRLIGTVRKRDGAFAHIRVIIINIYIHQTVVVQKVITYNNNNNSYKQK